MGCAASSAQEGALNAEAMRDPLAKSEPGLDSYYSPPRVGPSPCLRAFSITTLLLIVSMLFDATQKLPLDRLGAQLHQDIGCDVTCARLLGEAGYLLTMGVAALLAGAFADLVGHRPRTLAIALTLCAVLVGVTSAAGSVGALVVPRLLTALPNSLAVPLLFPFLLDKAKSGSTQGIGTLVGVLCLAPHLASGFLAFLSWVGTWRTAFATLTVTSLAFSFPLLALPESPPRPPHAEAWCGPPPAADLAAACRGIRALLSHSPSLRLLLCAQSLLRLATSACAHGLPALLVHERAASWAQVDAAENALCGTTFPLVVVVGALSDVFVRRTGASRIWLWVGFVAATFIFFFPAVYVTSSVDSAGANVFMILLYILSSCTDSLKYLTLIDATPPQALGRALGLQMLIVDGVGSLGAPLFDAFAQGKVLNQYSPYQASVVFFGVLPTLLALAAAVPAALSATPSRLELDLHLRAK
ncbi:hypothetical protein AB1Y20_017905 [Prymnesium parvum]|uniref:Major facilitator superfamily (MFS) profile domain-containing protein n=1 Tax=Prymnesium parvum TaxID=97485 RepID=A0AB34JNC7_PRYPA